jgi:hypothetical protein
MSSGRQKIAAADLHQIEGDQLAASVMLAGMQQLEVANAAIAFDHALPVQHEMLGRQPQCRLHDRRIASGSVIAAAGDDLDGIAGPPHERPIAVLFHLMDPVPPGRDRDRSGGNGGFWNFGRPSAILFTLRPTHVGRRLGM